MSGIEKESKEAGPSWVRPNIGREKGEIERVAKEFLLKEPDEETVQMIARTLDNAPMVDMSEEDWEQLENTDSFHNVRVGHMEDAQQITEHYNEQLPPENKRNLQTIVDGFASGGTMEAPTILKNKQGKLHLVSGNTRLMVSRALGIRPEVIIGELS